MATIEAILLPQIHAWCLQGTLQSCSASVRTTLLWWQRNFISSASSIENQGIKSLGTAICLGDKIFSRIVPECKIGLEVFSFGEPSEEFTTFCNVS